MRAYRCNNPGDVDASVLRITQLLSLQSSQTDEHRHSSITWTRQLLCFFGAEGVIFTTTASHFISSASLGNQRPPFEESRALCYSPALNFGPLQHRGFPVRTRSARLVSPCAWELCCQGRNFHFDFLLSKVWMWHEMRYGSRANWYLINVWPDWRAQAHLPHVSSNMHDLQAGSLPQQTFHAMRSMNVKRRALPAHRGCKSSCRNSACTVPTRVIFYA